jgi:hypothetical protein
MKETVRLKLDKWQWLRNMSSCGTLYRHFCRELITQYCLAVTTFESSEPLWNSMPVNNLENQTLPLFEIQCNLM